MKNPQLKKIASLTGLLLGAFALSAFAATWTAAPCSPPNCNIDAPINVGTVAQTKSGKVGILNSIKTGGTAANPYASTGYMLEVNGNSLMSGLNVNGKIFTDQLAIMGGDITQGNILVSDGDGLAVWTNPDFLKDGVIPPNTTATPSFFSDLSSVAPNNSSYIKYISLLDPGTYTFSGRVATANSGGGGLAAVFFSTSDDPSTAQSYISSLCEGYTGASGDDYKWYSNINNPNILFCLKRNGYNDSTYTIPTTVVTFTSPTFMYASVVQASMSGYVHY